MITDLGSGTLGDAIPMGITAIAAINATVAIAAPDVSAQLSAMASFTPMANLSFSAQLSIAQSIVANIQAAISAGIIPPSLSVQANVASAFIADLTAKLGTIEAQADISADITALLAAGGVRVLVYSGPRDDFGSELATALGAGSTSCNAIVLLTTSGATWTAMQGVLKTS